MEEKNISNFYKVDIKNKGRDLVAHLSCSHVKDTVTIKSLFVRKKYRNQGLEELLICSAEKYAKEKRASKIVVYCGPEPYCKDGQVPLAKEIAFYEQCGFKLDHYLLGVTPCMEKIISAEVCV